MKIFVHRYIRRIRRQPGVVCLCVSPNNQDFIWLNIINEFIYWNPRTNRTPAQSVYLSHFYIQVHCNWGKLAIFKLNFTFTDVSLNSPSAFCFILFFCSSRKFCFTHHLTTKFCAETETRESPQWIDFTHHTHQWSYHQHSIFTLSYHSVFSFPNIRATIKLDY